MKRNLLISAGGTATAWHLASLVCERFSAEFNLFVCDIHPPHLVPASRLADRFFQVPPIDSPGYDAAMLELFKTHGIDIFVPLIDADVHRFAVDDPHLLRLGVRSTGTLKSTSSIIGNKRDLSAFLDRRGFPCPKVLNMEEISSRPSGDFFVKPEEGFGSRGALRVAGSELARTVDEGPHLMVQELCFAPELTVEVFNHGGVLSLCRERIEVKAGVCTKARVFQDEAIQTLAERLCGAINLPVAFCFQVMTGADGSWRITDINPRLGAGTALSTAYGWSLASAALAIWGDLPVDPRQFLNVRPSEVFVTRVYRELVMD